MSGRDLLRLPLVTLLLAAGCASTGPGPDQTQTSTDAAVETSTATSTDETAGLLEATGPEVVLTTSKGEIVIRLYEQQAPLTSANFLSYLDRKFYDRTLFHRVVPGSLVQGGGIAADGSEKAVKGPVKNESDNGLSNVRGTVGAARRTDFPNSATSQFFINVADNSYLDFPQMNGSGFTVFAQVVSGLEVADAIAAVDVDGNERPTADVLLESAVRR